MTRVLRDPLQSMECQRNLNIGQLKKHTDEKPQKVVFPSLVQKGKLHPSLGPLPFSS